MNQEVSTKLELIRQTLAEHEVQGIRLRGTDWFSWATAGASHTVLLTSETGVAEVLVTAENAWILTDEIEAQRLKDEELPPNFQVDISPWADAANRESFVRDVTNGGKILHVTPTAEQIGKQAMMVFCANGFNHAIFEHHQGGTTGYLAREVVATPTATETLAAGMVVAWNPSVPGTKVEDTFVILEDGKLENLTFDGNFPNVEVEGRLRALPLRK
jgi:hypothetical protein